MADFTLYRGDTVELNIVVTASGSAYSLTGRSLWFTAKYAYKDADAAAVFQKTIGNGITVTSASGGLATVKILATDTSSLPSSKTLLVYDLQCKDPSGNIYTLASGNLVFLPDVTKSTS